MRAFELEDAPFSPRFKAFQAHVAGLDLERTLKGIGLSFERRGYDARLACPFHDAGGVKQTIALRLEGEKAGYWHCWFPGCEEKGFLGRLVRAVLEIDHQEAERLLGFTEGHALPRATVGALDWQGLFANAPAERPVICQRSWRGAPPLPLPERAMPGPLFRDARLVKYLTSAARGFEGAEALIAAYDLTLGDWARDGTQWVPGLRCFFPIRDRQGRRVGWGARSVEGQSPKMIYPQGFASGRVLGGEDRLAEMLGWEAGRVVLVEGYFDQMKCFTLGIPALCLWGSALTPDQGRTLTTAGVTGVTLALDGDAAGQAGIRKAWAVLAGRLPLDWVRFPAGRDPGNLRTREEWQGLPRRPASALLGGK